MDDEALKEEFKVEMELLELKKWKDSGTEDDFKTWQIKKYVDTRINQLIIGLIVGALVFIFLSKNF